MFASSVSLSAIALPYDLRSEMEKISLELSVIDKRFPIERCLTIVILYSTNYEEKTSIQMVTRLEDHLHLHPAYKFSHPL